MNFLNSLQNIISEASSTIQEKFKRKKTDGVVGPEVGVLMKLSLVGLAKLSQLICSWLRLCLASASYRGIEVYDRQVYRTQPANSQMIPQNVMKYLGLARLA